MDKKLPRPLIALVLGGARSGKSAFAEELLGQICDQRVYLATAEARDDEMTARITAHQSTRRAGWRTIEAPLDPVAALSDVAAGEGVLLDCLTLWLSNQMEAGADLDVATQVLLEGVSELNKPVVMVSNEIGMGLVPDTSLGRSFRDAQGRLNQSAAKAADLVVFVAAGLPLVLKGELP